MKNEMSKSTCNKEFETHSIFFFFFWVLYNKSMNQHYIVQNAPFPEIPLKERCGGFTVPKHIYIDNNISYNSGNND